MNLDVNMGPGNRRAELLKELEVKFKQTKDDLGFKASFEELDGVFFLKDAVLSAGFVSEAFSRQICSRIVETYSNWNNYLHGLIMPNPHHILNVNESKMIDDEEKKVVTGLLSESMALASTNTLIGLTQDKKSEGKFIDDSLEFWKSSFKPKAGKVIKKINDGWKKG
tara:strand:+ start:421 stop:921 length:501 start_codon:yes stop_codon:yes gene_type:complete